MIFVSHQWLGVSHPDPEGQQLSVLRKALQSLLDNTLTVEDARHEFGLFKANPQSYVVVASLVVVRRQRGIGRERERERKKEREGEKLRIRVRDPLF